jgi:endonuclease/exonuclease/phosphatase family metal-dependent hydrolase
MKKTIIVLVFICSGFSLFSQNFSNLNFGTDPTFEVMTWNIEWFPKNGAVTVNYVIEIIEALDIDVLAIQEIHNNQAFYQMLDSLDGWEGYSVIRDYQNLAYIYNSNVVELTAIYEIFTTLSRPFPKSPLVMELLFMDQEYIIINNHLKCCGDGIMDLDDPWDEETRRKDACDFLDQYITVNFDSERVILTGDFNDDLADEPPNNVFEVFLSDSNHYLATDLEIAFGSPLDWSYPTWPSHLDHIFISNELFEDFEGDGAEIQVIKIEDDMAGGWWDYDNNISDHRPVAIKFASNDMALGVNEPINQRAIINAFPNPSNGIFNFAFDAIDKIAVIEIYTIYGQLIDHLFINNGGSTAIWNATNFPKGIYYSRFVIDQKIESKNKLVLIK